MTVQASYRASVATGKSVIARDFGAASNTYNPAARLQQTMGQVMVDQIQPWSASDCSGAATAESAGLDLGCGTGWFTGQVADRFSADTMLGIDLAPGMLHFARSANAPGLQWLAGDAEFLPLADNSVDLIFSNLMIQWAGEPQKVLAECRRVLRPGGQLFVSTLLDGTLDELRDAWHQADPDHEHVNCFDSEHYFQQQALQVFPGARIVRESISLDYPTPLALLLELKAIGAGFKGASRRTSATAPGRLKAMCRHYPVAADDRVYATYEAAWLTCRLSD